MLTNLWQHHNSSIRTRAHLVQTNPPCRQAKWQKVSVIQNTRIKLFGDTMRRAKVDRQEAQIRNWDRLWLQQGTKEWQFGNQNLKSLPCQTSQAIIIINHNPKVPQLVIFATVNQPQSNLSQSFKDQQLLATQKDNFRSILTIKKTTHLILPFTKQRANPYLSNQNL